MHLKKLELFGFKSFADKTALHFQPGITAIVGPNGCGKSNIFDSIRWVLGEQSARDLRGSSMEDVIFNGTEKKPSLGFAEVNLVFSDVSSGELPTDQQEVKITRRLFRSGESEYLINDTVSRLKDVHLLLMGTGIGHEAYSLIQQGRVDLIVNAKPEERRFIIDEASGITKYKAQKKEAMSKLGDTDNNLLRINDIVIEIKKQIASIERQANKARKYQEEFEKLKGYEIKLARTKIDEYETKKRDFENKLAEFKKLQESLNVQLEAQQEQLTNEINGLDETEQKINDINAEEIKQQSQMDQGHQQIGFNQERIQNLTLSNQKLAEQKEQLILRCKEQQKKIEDLKQDIETLQEAIRFNEEAIKEKRSALTHLERTIKESKERIREHEEKIFSLSARHVNTQNELTDVSKKLQENLSRKRRLEMELDKTLVEQQEVDQKMQNLGYQHQAVDGSKQELELDYQEHQGKLREIDAQLKQLSDEIDELEKKRVFFKSQKEFIEKLNTQYEDIPDPIIEGRFLTNVSPEDHHTGIVGKVKSVRSVDGQMFEITCETKFIELDPQQISRKINEINVQLTDANLKKDQFVIQRQEEVDISQQVQEEIQAKENVLSVIVAQKKDVVAILEKLNKELELFRLELDETKGTIDVVHKKEEELKYQLDTTTKEIEWTRNDIKDKQALISTKSQDKEEISVSIAQMETEAESDKEKLNVQQGSIEEFTLSLDQWLGEIKKIDDDVTNNINKREEYKRNIDELELKIEGIRLNKESLKESAVALESQKQQQGKVINQSRTAILALEEELEEVKQRVHGQELNDQQIGFNVQAIKDRLQQAYKIDYDTLSAEPEAASEQSEAPAQEGTVSFEEELEKLRKRCESYGSVNLVAIEEHEELKQRFEFLTKQQSDLLEAKSQLMETISKINRTTRRMFMDTFTVVSEEFRIHFRMLFGGGDAELILLDPENALESGIEIVARPPGKKLQNIDLLSGGEKSLTAIALIFGVFKVKPSPFCVLDEIDAALDEANVGRFSYLLKDFAKIAQFIVITHNKKTMASSDILYGITMPETGISRIVSVKFKDGEKKQEVPVAVAA